MKKIKYLKKNPFFLLFIPILFLISCHTQRSIIREPLKEAGNDYLFNKLDSTKLDFSILTAKADIKIQTKKKSTAFTANIRIKKDSAIWMSITPALGVEVARVLITIDTVKFVNRLQSTYFISDFSKLSTMIDFDLNFQLLQDIIIGNPYLFYPVDLYKSSIEKETYCLNTVNRIQLKKTTNKDRIGQKMFLDQTLFRLIEMNINDFKENRKLDIYYADFQNIENKSFATKHVYKIDTKKGAELAQEDPEEEVKSAKSKQTIIELEFSKISFTKESNFLFKIPEKYERIY